MWKAHDFKPADMVMIGLPYRYGDQRDVTLIGYGTIIEVSERYIIVRPGNKWMAERIKFTLRKSGEYRVVGTRFGPIVSGLPFKVAK